MLVCELRGMSICGCLCLEECEVQMMRKSELSVSRERQPWLELSNSITYIAYPSLKS